MQHLFRDTHLISFIISLASTTYSSRYEEIYWFFGPCIKLEFDGAGSGGADNTIADSCYSTKVCSGGDLHGAAWVKTYNGSNTNNAEITVPDNISAIIKDEYGISFAGTNDFVANFLSLQSDFVIMSQKCQC